MRGLGLCELCAGRGGRLGWHTLRPHGVAHSGKDDLHALARAKVRRALLHRVAGAR